MEEIAKTFTDHNGDEWVPKDKYIKHAKQMNSLKSYWGKQHDAVLDENEKLQETIDSQAREILKLRNLLNNCNGGENV